MCDIIPNKFLNCEVEVGVLSQGKRALSSTLLQGFKIMCHDVIRTKSILNFSSLYLKQPVHERENILFLTIFMM